MQSFTKKIMMLLTIVFLTVIFAFFWISNFGFTLPPTENSIPLINNEGWGLVFIGLFATIIALFSLLFEIRSSSPLAFIGWALYLPVLFNVLIPMFIMFFSIIGFFYTPWLGFTYLPIANQLINGVIILQDNTEKLLVSYIGYIFIVIGISIYIIGLYQLLSHTARKRSLFTVGLYAFVRHPQYLGIMFWTLGFAILGWRLINYMMWILLSYSYTLLAENEEVDLIKAYGAQYLVYRNKVPYIVPYPLSLIFGPFGRYMLNRKFRIITYTIFFFVLSVILYLSLQPYIMFFR